MYSRTTAALNVLYEQGPHNDSQYIRCGIGCVGWPGLALFLRPHGHLQQPHLPVVGGVRLVGVSREPRGAEESGRTLLARENLLLLALPALASLRVEHVRSESSTSSSSTSS